MKEQGARPGKLLRISAIAIAAVSLIVFVAFSLLHDDLVAAFALLVLDFGIGLLMVDLRFMAREITGIKWLDRRYLTKLAMFCFCLGWLCIVGGLIFFVWSLIFQPGKAVNGAQLPLFGLAFLIFYEQKMSKQALNYIRTLNHLRISRIARRWWRQRGR